MTDNLILLLANAALLNRYLTVASSTLYLYDLLLTFDLEVDHLWPSKWTLTKVVYLLQRYLPLIDTVILAITWQFGDINPWTCEVLIRVSSWSFVIGITLSEVILMHRTLAVWGNNRKLRIAVFLFFLGCILPIFWMMNGYHETLTCSFVLSTMEPTADIRWIDHSTPIPGMHCFATGKSRSNYLCWTLLTVYDTGLLVLISIPAFQIRRSGGPVSILCQVVYRDGILYYLYVVALSAINIILILELPLDSNATLKLLSLERVIYPILASHVVLHIREQAYQGEVVNLEFPNSVDAINAEVEFRRSEI
ncbi:hypothetical protein BDN72DRAFT_838271 [Pluteus cervinus]|uniref:Uncharacterized protein n=1 Tax=Pluteus cervinus TaxID=181527 RepID=A0ACD3AZ28_9AGAR|nr:hypothetical protein BDN72DRAFT_838271 [Pluteus cervinus]